MSLEIIIALIGVIISYIALTVVIIYEIKRYRNAERALVNSLFEEIWTNIKLSRRFIDADSAFVKRITEVLEIYYQKNGAPRDIWVYPNPTDLFLKVKHKPPESIFLGIENSISKIKFKADKKKTFFLYY